MGNKKSPMRNEESTESTLDKKLEPENWQKIIKYIPKKDRKDLALVNSYFYDIICKIEKEKRHLQVFSSDVS